MEIETTVSSNGHSPYPFDGNCPCSQDADLTLIFDGDEAPLHAHSCLLAMTSPVLKMAMESCSVGDGVIQLGHDDKRGWILLLNLLHPVSSLHLNRTQIYDSLSNRVALGTLAKKYDIRFVLEQMDEVLSERIPFILREPPISQAPSYYEFPPYNPLPLLPYVPNFLFLHPSPSLRGGHYSFPPSRPFPPGNCIYGMSKKLLIEMIEHAAQFNLKKTWRSCLDTLLPLLRNQVMATAGMEKSLGSSGQKVKSMLEHLRENGFEKEALEFAIRFFDHF